VTELERIGGFLDASEESACDEVRRVPCGTALLTPTLPLVWQMNALRVEDEHACAEEVAAAAEAALGHLGHRQVFVPDAEHGARMAPALRKLGWNATRLLVMVLRRDPDRAAPSGLGAEVERGAGAAALGRFRREQTLEGGDEAIRQLEAMDGRYAGARDFGAPAGECHACCRLLSGDGVGQLDQVCTVRAERNRGYARAAVLAAAAAAVADGLDLVFLLTDADDWPKRLYRKLGFDAAGEQWEFLKLPLGTASP
jgi:hypothetical protein